MITHTHRFFADSSFTGDAGLKELPPPPWAPGVLPEFRFTYDVLERALAEVAHKELRFYFTKDAYSLPEYGANVVAVLLQEERCKVPVYGRHVRAVLRNLQQRPFLGFTPGLRMGHLDAVLMFEYARDWYTHMRSVRAYRAPHPEWPVPVRNEPAIVHMPLGYHSQVELPQVPMPERALDLFFAGEIRHFVPKNDYRYWTSTSKFEARAQVWRELHRLKAENEWTLDLGNTGGATGLSSSGFDSYSEKMAQSRICVSPRGSMAETYRSFEGLRAGCWVIANPVPKESMLYDAPIQVIQHWRELGPLMKKYARNMDFLEEQRAKSLAFWHERLTPEKIAVKVTAALNRL